MIEECCNFIARNKFFQKCSYIRNSLITIETMPIYKVTTKGTCNSAGMHIEPGMSVEISTIFPVAMIGSMIAEPVQRAFMAKYGVDLKKMNCLTAAYLKIEKK